MLSHRHDEWDFHYLEKLDDPPGIELPVETECFNSEPQVGDPFKRARDVPDLGDPMTMWVCRQGHLPVFEYMYLEQKERGTTVPCSRAFSPPVLL